MNKSVGIIASIILLPNLALAQPAKLDLRKGDRVVFMGDTFAEREGMFGYIETMLHSQFPEHKLTFRNLAYPADTPKVLLADLEGTHEYNHSSNRALNFGAMTKHLTDVKADVIILCLGMAASLERKDKVDENVKDLQALLKAYGEKQFNGKSPPRFILVGPIPHEKLGGEFPDPAENNEQLALFNGAMERVAKVNKIPFVDLFRPMAKLMENNPGDKFTFNGIHLTQYGYWAAAQLFVEQLGLTVPTYYSEVALGRGDANTVFELGMWQEDKLPPPPPLTCRNVHPELLEKQYILKMEQKIFPQFAVRFDGKPWVSFVGQNFEKGFRLMTTPAHEAAERLRRSVVARNTNFYYRFRAVNGEYIYGRRASPFGIVNFPGELKKLDEICLDLDKAIHGLIKVPGPHKFGIARADKPIPNPIKITDPPPPDIANVYNQKQGIIGGKDYPTAKDPEEERKLFKLPEGYDINLFASEKDFPLHNPIAMAWDTKGRLWVTTMPSYPHAIPGVPPNDKVLILEDTNGDGKADKCTVFADRLYLPTGIEFGEGGVYVAAQPNLLFLKDTDGDDVADSREVILHGFGTGDSHHAIHTFVRGPDGALYLHEGIFHRTNVETPWGVLRQHDAAIWRFQPKSHKLELYVSYHFANPWGHVFDKWGFNFIADASGGANYNALPITGHVEFPRQHPGMKVFTQPIVRPTCGCEIVSSRHFPDDAQGNFLFNNNIGFQGIKQFKLIEEGANAPLAPAGERGRGEGGSGFTSKELEPLLVSKDPNFRPVALKFGPDGALYVVDWFNPLIGHMQHSIRDGGRDHYHGRIWRITAKGRPLVKMPKIAGARVGPLFDLLESPEDVTRYRVRAELRERKRAEVIPQLNNWIKMLGDAKEQDEHLLLEALWVQHSHNAVNSELLARLLRAKDYQVRAAATRLLRERNAYPTLSQAKIEFLNELFDQFSEGRGYFLLSEGSMMRGTLEQFAKENGIIDGKIHRQQFLDFHAFLQAKRRGDSAITGSLALLQTQTNDVHPRVRLEAIVALSYFKTPLAAEIALDALKHPMDYYLDYALKETITTLEPYWKPVLTSGRPFAVNNPAGTNYLLASVSNEELMRMPPSEAVCLALLTRPHVAAEMRNAALSSLARQRKSEPFEQLLKLIDDLDSGHVKPHSGVNRSHILADLGGLLPLQPERELKRARKRIEKLALAGKQPATRRSAMGALIMAEGSPEIFLLAESLANKQDFFEALLLVPDDKRRAEAFPTVLHVTALGYFAVGEEEMIRAALRSLPAMPGREDLAIEILAKHCWTPEFNATAFAAMRRIPAKSWSVKEVRPFLKDLVKYLKKLPPKERTEIAALDALQLGNDLAALLPAAEAKEIGAQLGELGVQVVIVRTIPHLMLFDRPKFYVEAGKPVVVVLENNDIMPHNLLISEPGSLAEIGLAAERMANDPDAQAKGFIPASKKVLHATRLLQPREVDRLQFVAPKTPGAYVYVCTFPGHWRVMSGVMHVVPKLADVPASELNPPTKSHGETRAFVRNWTVEELTPDLINLDKNRSFVKGKELFKAASCIQCHKLGGEGSDLGPDLAETAKKLAELKMSKIELLREVLDPSKVMLDKYKPRTFITTKGDVLSGLVVHRDKDVVRIANNPLEKPKEIRVADIDEESESKVSIMPNGLLVTLQREEIYELLSYIVAGGDADHPLYRRRE